MWNDSFHDKGSVIVAFHDVNALAPRYRLEGKETFNAVFSTNSLGGTIQPSLDDDCRSRFIGFAVLTSFPVRANHKGKLLYALASLQ